MPELTDLSVIRALCEKYDFALSKGFDRTLSSARACRPRSWMPVAWISAMVSLRSAPASVC